ncbi:hypothetical protein [Burkholderia cepacia]|nr:hypothetical protein [Burkholderia cepacia]
MQVRPAAHRNLVAQVKDLSDPGHLRADRCGHLMKVRVRA